jgi:hypothetical protein
MNRKLTEKKLPSGTIEWYDAQGVLVKKMTRSGQVQWFDEQGQLHRADGPAIENPDGSRMWMCHGKEHRANGPAVETPDKKEWYKFGERHRNDGPAIEFSDGRMAWYRNGKKMKPSAVQAYLEKNAEQVAKDFRTGLDHRVTMRRGMLQNLKKKPGKA